MTRSAEWRGSRGQGFRRLVFATYGDVCHLCHHGGAKQVDHVEAYTERPELEWDLRNCRPAHGSFNPCPVCHQYCNQVRGGYSIERAQRIIAGRAAKKTPKPAPPQDAGREW
jgi:hypothetical protein